MRVVELVSRFVGWGDRRPMDAVRYTSECAHCGVPDDAAVRYPHGVSVCRECHESENEDGC